MTELVITNATVVTRTATFIGTVVSRDGTIVAVDEGRSRAPGAIDCAGDYLIPGLVELHTDNLEKHFQPRPGVTWPSLPATLAHDSQVVAAGITTVYDAVSAGELFEGSGRARLLQTMVEAIRYGAGANLFRAEHFVHIRCELSFPGLVELFMSLYDLPETRLVSLMDHTPGQRQFAKLDRYREYYSGKYGLSEQEMQDLMDRQIAQQEEHGARHRQTIVSLCRAKRVPMASHDDATVEHVAEAALDGVSIAEFPTTVEAAAACRRHGLAILMGGPNLVLGRSHSGNVSAQTLAELGLVDMVSSDYVPSSCLQALFALAKGRIDLPDAIALGTANPAAAAGLADRGQIAVGRRADLVRVRSVAGTPAAVSVWRSADRIL
jgi:alpha-D-ribose 1-methylphosphonate 5-triphosphate diphosphatase